MVTLPLASVRTPCQVSRGLSVFQLVLLVQLGPPVAS